MNKFKKITASFLLALTTLGQPAFAANKYISKVAKIATGSAILAAGVYTVVIRDVAKSNIIDVSNDFFLTENAVQKCKKTKRLIQRNRFLFTKKELADMEKILDEKISKYTRACNLMKNREQHIQIMNKLSDLYKINLINKQNGDMKNYKLCEKMIASLLEEDNNLSY